MSQKGSRPEAEEVVGADLGDEGGAGLIPRCPSGGSPAAQSPVGVNPGRRLVAADDGGRMPAVGRRSGCRSQTAVSGQSGEQGIDACADLRELPVWAVQTAVKILQDLL